MATVASLRCYTSQSGGCSPEASWGLEVYLSLMKAHSHSGKEIAEEFRDLEPYLARDQ